MCKQAMESMEAWVQLQDQGQSIKATVESVLFCGAETWTLKHS